MIPVLIVNQRQASTCHAVISTTPKRPLRTVMVGGILLLGLLMFLVGCSGSSAAPTPIPATQNNDLSLPYEFATLDTIAALGQFDPIPELRVYLQAPDIAAIEGQVRALFAAKGYTVTLDERSGDTLILQFERERSIYAARIAPLPDAAGQSLQILGMSADSAFSESQNEGVPASFWKLSLGDCVLANDSTQTLEKIACDQPHFGEVVGAWNLPANKVPFPGDEVWLNVYTYECAAAFKDYTGDEPTGEHEYWYSGFGPTPASWATGDRAVLCILFNADGLSLDHSARNEFR